MEILKLLAKLRMGSVYHITYFMYPELRDKRRNDTKFESARKSVAKILKRLQDAKHIKTVRPPNTGAVYYYLTQEGQRAVYAELKISELDKGQRSGFDFDLGYFEWRVPPHDNVHFQFQTDVLASVMSLNKGVEIAAMENESTWEYGGVKLANICSIRDNLHASPRNSKLKEVDVYKPDSEIVFRQSRYNKQAQLMLNNKQRILVEQEFYFVECDRKTEYGERLDAKFIRLNKRLAELESRNELRYFKGMIVVLDDNQNYSADQVRARHYRFFISFKEHCSKYIEQFNIITTTYSALSKTLLGLRREYKQDFGNALLQSWKYPALNKTFLYEQNLTDRSNSFTNIDGTIGNIRARFNALGTHLCLFMELEGLTTVEWNRMIYIYNMFRTKAQQHNESGGNKYKVVPIVTYRLERPYSPQELSNHPFIREHEVFFENMYYYDITNTRPILYKGHEVVNFEEAEFIIN